MTLKYYHIWMEGFAVTGNIERAKCITEKPVLARSFNQAVKKFKFQNPGLNIEKNRRSKYITVEDYKNRKSNWNIWGCNLYPDEESARKAFG